MKKYFTLPCIFLLGFLTGCKDENVVPLKGDIVGFVKLFDEDGTELLERKSVTVKLDESRSAVTDDFGRFEFKGVEPGTFKLVYQKEGYSAFTHYNFNFAGGSVPAVVWETNLIKLPETEVTSHTIQNNGGRVTVSGTMKEADSYYFIYYVGKDEEVSNIKYESSSGFKFCCGSITAFSHSLALPSWSGPVYIAAYAASRGNEQFQFSYFDYEKGVSTNGAVKKLFGPLKVR